MALFEIAFVGAQFIAPFRKPTAGKQGVINHAPTKNHGTNNWRHETGRYEYRPYE